MGIKKIKGVKGFKKGMICKDKQYSENKLFTENKLLKICESGMHFCQTPLDVFKYYPPKIETEYAEVQNEGDMIEGDDKITTNKLKIFSKISISKLFKLHFDLIFSKIKKESHNSHSNTNGYNSHSNTNGDYSHSNTNGDYSHSNTNGDNSHSNTDKSNSHSNTNGSNSHSNTDKSNSNTNGYNSHSNTNGDYSHSNTNGYYSHSNTNGSNSHSNTNGDNSHSNTNGSNSHSNTNGSNSHSNTNGSNSIASALGINSKVSAKKGWIILVDWRQDKHNKWYIHNIHRAKVGRHIIYGVKIQPDTAYWFKNGELKSKKQ